MSSSISILALCILILSNGCFTLPVVDEQIPSSTFTPVNNDVTTGEAINLRLVTDDDTTILPNVESLRSIDEHIGFEVSSTPSIDLSGNKFVKALRVFDEYSTPAESTITTTEESNPQKREFDDLPFTTVESMVETDDADRRSIENEFENGTQIMQVETTTATINTTVPLTSTTVVSETSTAVPLTSTTVVSETSTAVPLTSTTVVSETSTTVPLTSTMVVPETSTTVPLTSTTVVAETSTTVPFTSTTVVPETSTTVPLTSTTDVPETSTTVPFTSTTVVPKISKKVPSTSTIVGRKAITKLPFKSTTVVPKTSTKVPLTSTSSATSSSTSTENYVGHLNDENKYDEDYEPSTKHTKIQRKPGVSSTKKSKVNLEDKSEEKEEYPKESTVPTAVFDQQALDKVSNVPNDFLVLDENNDLVVTGLPNRTFTTSKANKQEEEAKPLNQGEESSYSQEKESDH